MKNMCCEKISVSDSKLFSQAASKWKMIGYLLNVPSGSLDSIERDSSGVCDALSAVFTAWRRTKCSPYSWKIILKVLATDVVGHRRLAHDIARRLSGEIGDCICIILCFISSLIECVVCNPVLWDNAAIVMKLNCVISNGCMCVSVRAVKYLTTAYIKAFCAWK